MRWAGYVAGVRCTQDFGGENLGKESLGRSRCKYDDNFKTDIQEVG